MAFFFYDEKVHNHNVRLQQVEVDIVYSLWVWGYMTDELFLEILTQSNINLPLGFYLTSGR